MPKILSGDPVATREVLGYDEDFWMVLEGSLVRVVSLLLCCFFKEALLGS